MIAVAFATLAISFGNLQLNSHYTAYFDDADPRLVTNAEISKQYSRHDDVFVVLQSDDSFLNGENYALLENVSELLREQPYAVSVLSVTELGIVGDTMTSDGHLIPSLEQLADESEAVGLLLSQDSTLAGVQVQLNLPNNDSSTVLDTVGTIREAVIAAIGDRPVSAHFTGALALNEAYINVVRHDLTRIVPLLIVTMIIVLGVLLRSIRAVFTLLPVGIVAVIAALGAAALFRTELAAINAFVPIIILSISLAGCVHMAFSYVHFRDSGKAPDEAALAAAKYNRLPMLLANGTTALGFAGLTLSPSPPVRTVGYLVAVGIVVSFILCLTLLPTLQARFDPWKPKSRRRCTAIGRLAFFTTNRRSGIIAIFFVMALPAGWFASQNVISDNVFEYFVPSHPYYRDTQLVESRLSGVNEIRYSLDSGSALGLFDINTVDKLHGFATWLEKQPEVNRIVAFSNTAIIREARLQGRLGERLAFYRNRAEEPKNRSALIASLASSDYSATLISVFLQRMDSTALIDFDSRVHAWAKQNMTDFALSSGGPTLMFANLGEQNIRSMLTALIIALFGAALVLGVVHRSYRTAWIGLVCNLLPVLLIYAVWAIVDGQISIGAAVVMGMILGIVLDDTIYLLTSYRRGRVQNLAEPATHALRRVGPALVVTTLTLVSGLSLGLLSDFGPIWSMSLLSVLIIATALIVDLLLLPALLNVTKESRAA